MHGTAEEKKNSTSGNEWKMLPLFVSIFSTDFFFPITLALCRFAALRAVNQSSTHSLIVPFFLMDSGYSSCRWQCRRDVFSYEATMYATMYAHVFFFLSFKYTYICFFFICKRQKVDSNEKKWRIKKKKIDVYIFYGGV